VARKPQVPGERVPVWTWRDAIRKASVPPYTKHVCNMIANYLSDVGEGCYPSVKSLMADTGLSNRSIATHLENARQYGLLDIRREMGANGRFKRTYYFPRFPNDVELPRASASPSQTLPPAGAVSQNRVKLLHAGAPREPDDANRVNLVREPREGASRRTIQRNNSKNCPSAKISKSDLESEVKPAAKRGPIQLDEALEPALRAALAKLGKGVGAL
jgi:hypothetical protein